MSLDSQRAIDAIERNCQNARRLTSLWEMMNQIDTALLAYMTLYSPLTTLSRKRKSYRKAVTVSENHHLKQLLVIDHLENIFRRQRIVDCVEYCLVAKDILSKPFVDVATMSSSLIRLSCTAFKRKSYCGYRQIASNLPKKMLCLTTLSKTSFQLPAVTYKPQGIASPPNAPRLLFST
jgi:hypothetical protein